MSKTKTKINSDPEDIKLVQESLRKAQEEYYKQGKHKTKTFSNGFLFLIFLIALVIIITLFG